MEGVEKRGKDREREREGRKNVWFYNEFIYYMKSAESRKLYAEQME